MAVDALDGLCSLTFGSKDNFWKVERHHKRTSATDPGRRPVFSECHCSWIFIVSLIVGNDSENHSAPVQSAADLEVPDRI